MTIFWQIGRLVALFCLVSLPGFSTMAGESNDELAKAAQNPVANLISVPFQDNINFNVGPEEKTQSVRTGPGVCRHS